MNPETRKQLAIIEGQRIMRRIRCLQIPLKAYDLDFDPYYKAYYKTLFLLSLVVMLELLRLHDWTENPQEPDIERYTAPIKSIKYLNFL